MKPFKEKFKGTPGPWIIRRGASNMKGIISGFRWSGFAKVYLSIKDGNPSDRAEGEANAALIAAAPELLVALEDLWLRSTNLFGELTIDEIKADISLQGLSESIDNAKVAIAKALNTNI